MAMGAIHLRREGGMVLIEVLMAVMIFSFGVLGLVAMQAKAIKLQADAKLRAEAAYLAGQMISQIWADRSNLATYNYHESGSPSNGQCSFTGTNVGDPSLSPNVATWLGSTTQQGTVLYLPSAVAQVTANSSTNLVTVTICWQGPQDTSMHNFTSTALISG